MDSQTAHVLFVRGETDTNPTTVAAVDQGSDRLTVDPVMGASDARHRLVTGHYDCVVSSYDLPETNGVELLTAVRQAHGALPFVLVTHDGSEEIASQAISAGVTEYLQVSPSTDLSSELPTRIHDALDRPQPAEQAGGARQHLEELGTASNDIHWLFSADWRETLFTNDVYEDIWGRSVEHLRDDPRDFLQGVHPEDRDLVETNMEALTAGESVDIEFRVNAAEQYQRWVWVQAEPICDDNGNVVRVAGFTRDISDRVERRQQLKQAEARFRTLAENFPNGGVHYFDRDFRYQFVSGSGFQALETDPADLEGNTIYDVTPYSPGAIETIESLMQAAIDGSQQTVEITYEDHIHKLHAVPLRDDGTVTGGFFISQDVTEHRRRERELEARVTVMNAAIDGMAILDESEEYAFVNQAHADIYGYDDPAVFKNNTWRICYDESAVNHFESEIMPTLYAEGEWRGEVTGVRKDGSSFPQALSLSLTEDRRVICVVRDVTERKARAERMARQNERLDEFVSVVSHDLRNPLQVAEGRLELAQSACDCAHLDPIERAVERMDDLIDDLLTLARQDDSVTNPASIAIEGTAESSWTNVATANATLVTDSDRNVHADLGQLKQLFENLFRNAIEHGGDDITVTVGDLADGFYVEDDGPGIPAADRSAVFDAGYSTNDDGTGFGLNIVKRVATAHGWEIDVTDSDDGGARFEITGVQRDSP